MNTAEENRGKSLGKRKPFYSGHCWKKRQEVHCCLGSVNTINFKFPAPEQHSYVLLIVKTKTAVDTVDTRTLLLFPSDKCAAPVSIATSTYIQTGKQ